MKLYNSLLTGRKTVLHFDNSGKFGHDFREAQVRFDGRTFEVAVTDGFKFQTIMGGFMYLKEAIKFGQEQIKKAA